MLYRSRANAMSALMAAVCQAAASAKPPHGVVVLGAPPNKGSAGALMPKAHNVTVDFDAAGRAPYQAQALLTLASPAAHFAIPAGYRLILEKISVAGTAGGNGPVLPYVMTYPYTAAYGPVSYYFAINPGDAAETPFVAEYPVHQYAESLSAGLGYAGTRPQLMEFAVSVAGHLVAMV